MMERRRLLPEVGSIPQLMEMRPSTAPAAIQGKLGRVVAVADTGLGSEQNRRMLQGAGGHYILGEKLRLGIKGLPAEALSRAGSYRTLDNGLEIKEVVVGGESETRRRFVVVRNSTAAISAPPPPPAPHLRHLGLLGQSL